MPAREACAKATPNGAKGGLPVRSLASLTPVERFGADGQLKIPSDMKNPLRLAVFRALTPDEASGGAPAIPDLPPVDASAPTDFDALADAAYDAVDHERGESHEGDLPAEEATALDAAPEENDVRPEEGLSDEAARKYPMVGHLRALDDALSDPGKAAETLRAFVQGVADHHGVDVASMLGLGKAPAAPAPADDGWTEGFDSPEAHASAPVLARAGYASAGEHRLAQRLDALQAMVAPAVRSPAPCHP